ncbi:MAG: hypothetical protein ABI162_17765 [Luteolibacter sp.]
MVARCSGLVHFAAVRGVNPIRFAATRAFWPLAKPAAWAAGLGYERGRYADNMVVLCCTGEEAGAVLEKLRE